ncbi:conserved exported hypothetical protein [Gammaproteobacteria bacterium]
MVKMLSSVLVFSCALTFGLAARADSDDFKWVNKCIADNKGGAEDSVIMAYCSCMNNAMGSSDNQSISQWEKSHPEERTQCEKSSGWK